MNKKVLILFSLSVMISALNGQAKNSDKQFKQPEKPNIIFIFADDLGGVI